MKKNTGFLKLTLLLSAMNTMMAGAVVAPALPQIKHVFAHIEGSDLWVRMIISVPAIFIAIFSPLMGRLADRFGRKILLLSSLFLYGFAGTSGFWLDSLEFILIGRAILGIAVAGVMTITTTLVADYFEGEERNAYAGLQGAFMGFGGVLFISFSGWLADFNWHYSFLIYFFAWFVFLLGIKFLYEPARQKTQKHNTEQVKRPPLAKAIYILVFIGIFFFFLVPVQIPFVLKAIPNTNNAQIGYAISIMTLASALTSMNYKRIKKKFQFVTIYKIGLFNMALGYALVSISSSYIGIIFALFIAGTGAGLIMPTGTLWIMSIAPGPLRGQMLGSLSRAIFLGQFVSPILAQPIIHLVGVQKTFFYASVCLVCLMLALGFLPQFKIPKNKP